MPAFLEDITPFYGKIERNKAGQTLEEFLEKYDPYKYKNPSVTVDTVVLQIRPDQKSVFEEGVKVLLIKRGNHPSIGKWALPGGFIELYENTDDSAKRELFEETGIEGLPVEQLRAWGEYDRDPRARIVTVAYLAVIDHELPAKAGDDAADADYYLVDLKKQDCGEECGRKIVRYRMTFTGESNQEVLGAEVCYSENAAGILAQPSFRLEGSDGIACDHPLIILQGLLHLEERLAAR